ncbi:MAG: hypothetical protein HYZ58_04420 [Acidobacteria bacterium]|nr:hypothetical protein [Acidobacteriota bacterium]MBI3262378.1 hypothetical protein [Acidobacteriota bacterium]
MTEQGRGVGDQGSRTDRAKARPEADTPDTVLDALLASLVTPRTPVDLRASVLRRIGEGRDSRAAVGGWLSLNWRWAALAGAAAVVVMATAMVLWRGSSPQPSGGVARSARPAPASLAPPAGPAARAERVPNEVTAETTLARVERPAGRTSRGATRRPSVADASEVDVAVALPPLEAPAPLLVSELSTDGLQIERVPVSAPLEIAPLEIERIDVDRPRIPKR